MQAIANAIAEIEEGGGRVLILDPEQLFAEHILPVCLEREIRLSNTIIYVSETLDWGDFPQIAGEAVQSAAFSAIFLLKLEDEEE